MSERPAVSRAKRRLQSLNVDPRDIVERLDGVLVRLTHVPTGIVVQAQGEASVESNRAKAWTVFADKVEALKRGDENPRWVYFRGEYLDAKADEG